MTPYNMASLVPGGLISQQITFADTDNKSITENCNHELLSIKILNIMSCATLNSEY